MIQPANYDLWDKLVVPLLGILLTTYITLYINWRDKKEKKASEEKFERQKLLEQIKKEHNDKVLEQQKIIDELNTTLWYWRYLAKKVPYYAVMDHERFKMAVKDYQDNIWDVLMTIKLLGVRAGNLFQGKFNQQFTDIYSYITYTVDVEIESLIKLEGKEEFIPMAKKISRHFTDRVSTELTQKIENMVKMIYSEKQL